MTKRSTGVASKSTKPKIALRKNAVVIAVAIAVVIAAVALAAVVVVADAGKTLRMQRVA